jgi:hypothetical protein
MKSMAVLACLLVLCGHVATVRAGDEPAAAAAAGEGASPADSLRGSPAVPSPIAVLAAFERAWLAGASDSVLACMSPRSIEIALDRAGPTGGRFPPSQAAYLIKDLLHYGGMEEFRVVRFEWKGDSAPSAEITWAHRASGYEMRETLDVSLAFEDGAWRVVRVAAR